MTVEEWADLMRQAYGARDQETRERFARSLPFQDAMFDRWERARVLGFGEGASIYNSAAVFGEVDAGADTWIGPNVVLDGSGGGITIGSTCSISSGVQIFTHDTIAWALSAGRLPFRKGPVRIGSRCYLGSQSVIAAGVTVGDGSVVAANSFVNEDVVAGTIVGGTPAKPIGRVEERDGCPALVFDSGNVTMFEGAGDGQG